MKKTAVIEYKKDPLFWVKNNTLNFMRIVCAFSKDVYEILIICNRISINNINDVFACLEIK